RQERPDRREIETDERPAAPRELDRPTAGAAERLAEQRIHRQVKQRDGERACGQVGDAEAIRGSAVRDERSLAARRHQHADATGSLPGDAGRADTNTLTPERGGERPALGVSTDRAHELLPGPEP